ncbi:MAG: hypothetical protein B7Z20_01965 [Sphingobium sp. 32-64-5]|nr:MAG: hypothetical protein B7Z20_01965 [Sphingobium sp. 32-64-5]
MRRYVRRYVQPGDTFLYEGAPDLDFDVVTELWFDDRQSYDDAMIPLGQSEAAQLLAADERALFDMASIRRFVVDERESVLVE